MENRAHTKHRIKTSPRFAETKAAEILRTRFIQEVQHRGLERTRIL